jgi:valyl-tRNA synthetase
MRGALDSYRFNDAANILYHFTWHIFCDWYIELSKPMLATDKAQSAKWVLWFVLKNILELLHPIIPFVTEEIWQVLPGKKGASIVIAQYPKKNPKMDFPEEMNQMETILEVISGIRNIRGETNITPSLDIEVVIRVSSDNEKHLLEGNSSFITTLGRVKKISFISKDAPRPKKSALAIARGIEIYVPLEGIIDIGKEIERLDKQIAKIEIDLEAKNKKLSNKGFLEKADPDIVEEQTQIKAELEEKLSKLLHVRSILNESS